MNQDTRNEIVRLWHARTSIRRISERLGIARNTVREVLRSHEQERLTGGPHPDLPAPLLVRTSCLDPHLTLMEQLLKRYPDITAVRMLEELRAKGFQGKYTIVKDRLRVLRPHPLRTPILRFETGPGQQAQTDYGTYDIDFTQEGRRRVYAFSHILGYSRRQYLHFVASQDFATTIREHVRAFEYFGGVAHVGLYDSMKVVVSTWQDDEPIYNPRFLAFATHYGFRPWACRRRRPQTKGKVERPFFFVETNLLNARTFQSLAHLNEFGAWWLANVADIRCHRETKKRPIDLFEEERPHLIALPATPYDTAIVVYRTVDPEGVVNYLGNKYSVPWQYIGHLVPVRITEAELIAYGPKIDEIARHALFPRDVTGQASIDKRHLPGDDLRKRHAILRERFEELGEVGPRFLDGLIRRNRYGKDQAQRILALLGAYHRKDLIAALERAVRFGAFSFSAVERILAAQATPKPPMESMQDGSALHLSEELRKDPVTPRSGKEYEQLLFDEREEPGDEETPPELQATP